MNLWTFLKIILFGKYIGEGYGYCSEYERHSRIYKYKEKIYTIQIRKALEK